MEMTLGVKPNPTMVKKMREILVFRAFAKIRFEIYAMEGIAGKSGAVPIFFNKVK